MPRRICVRGVYVALAVAWCASASASPGLAQAPQEGAAGASGEGASTERSAPEQAGERPRQSGEGAASNGTSEGGSGDGSGVASPVYGGTSIAYHQAWYEVPAINRGLPTVADPPHLKTPQASLENLLDGCGRGEYARAAQSLDLELISVGARAQRGPELAKRLCEVLERRVWIDWSDIPDRPDAQPAPVPAVGSGSRGPRRSLEVGSVGVEGRDAEIRLQREKAPGRQPVWLVSPHTVERIDAMHASLGDDWLRRHVPSWLRVPIAPQVALWELVFLAAAVVLVWVLAHLLGRGVRWLVGRVDEEVADVVGGPGARLLAGALTFHLLVFAAGRLSAPAEFVLRPVTLALIVVGVTWLGMAFIKLVSDRRARRFADQPDEEGELEHRRQKLTNISVARRVFVFLALVAGIGALLMELEIAETLGTVLLSSAGIMAAVTAVAAHRVLGNVLAGIQIALTKPVRIGDNVWFEDDWGYVEDITYTFLVIRTWDQRRIIVPFNYFLSKPIENWTRTRSHVIKPVCFYVDYDAPIDVIRQRFVELVRSHPDWDGEDEPMVHLVDIEEDTLTMRGTCSARDPVAAWHMHCFLREKMVELIRELDGGRYLPRRRVVLGEEKVA